MALLLLLCILGIVMYGRHLSAEIERRFSGQRWSIPSRVYSDTSLLFPGQELDRGLFEKKLKRLGYRAVPHDPKHMGEMRLSDSSIRLFLHDFKVSSYEQKGVAIRISFRGNTIQSITDLRNGDAIPLLELEPEQLMLFFGPEREQRRLVSIEQVPDHVIHAVLAAEDTRFYRHHGIDPRGMLRALYANLKERGIKQGGSTITQQLVKNYFLTSDRTFSRKLKETIMALTMEVMYDKGEILEIYLNEIYLGQKGSVAVSGIGEASYFYFGKPVNELRPEEAAVIAGLIRAPNLYSPYVDEERCRERRNTVLHRMHENGWLSGEGMKDVQAQEVSPAGYERYGKKAPFFVDYLSEQLKTLYSPEDLTSLGLTIFTTLDTQVQEAAERALARGLERLEKAGPSLKRSEPLKQLQGAVLVMQPKTGYILAMAGGRDYSMSQFNRITQARRQPGSAFKPFVFLSGLDRFTPISMLSNEARTYTVEGGSWSPRNYAPMPEKEVTLRQALAQSVNLAAVDLGMEVGMDQIVATASTFGFTTPLRPYPSLSLGTSEVIPLELARAYCAFAADGRLPYPLSLKEVLDEKGQRLEQRHMRVEQVTSPAKAFLMNSLLASVVTEGTARSLKSMGIFFPLAGKTGTTNDYRDAWFVGYTPDILALVWVGFDDGTPIGASGSSAALPIWADLVKSIPQHLSGRWFRMPPGVVERAVCSESNRPAVPGRCPETYDEFFLEENVPEETCPIHVTLNPFERIFKEVRDLIRKF
ncbi:MAG: PBP1A family penicillin-binding protein [Desulfatiglandales bacterium]